MSVVNLNIRHRYECMCTGEVFFAFFAAKTSIIRILYQSLYPAQYTTIDIFSVKLIKWLSIFINKQTIYPPPRYHLMDSPLWWCWNLIKDYSFTPPSHYFNYLLIIITIYYPWYQWYLGTSTWIMWSKQYQKPLCTTLYIFCPICNNCHSPTTTST